MAKKDKTEKASKSKAGKAEVETKAKGKVETKAKGKGKGGDEFAKPSDAPNTGGDGWRFEVEDNIGSLFLINPLREEDFVSEEYGASKIIVADIVEIHEKKPEKSEVHEEVFVFDGWTKGSLRGYIGDRKVLARLGQGDKVGKKSAPWILEDADDDDIAMARAYMAQVDPLGTGKTKKKGK